MKLTLKISHFAGLVVLRACFGAYTNKERACTPRVRRVTDADSFRFTGPHDHLFEMRTSAPDEIMTRKCAKAGLCWCDMALWHINIISHSPARAFDTVEAQIIAFNILLDLISTCLARF